MNLHIRNLWIMRINCKCLKTSHTEKIFILSSPRIDSLSGEGNQAWKSISLSTFQAILPCLLEAGAVKKSTAIPGPHGGPPPWKLVGEGKDLCLSISSFHDDEPWHRFLFMLWWVLAIYKFTFFYFEKFPKLLMNSSPPSSPVCLSGTYFNWTSCLLLHFFFSFLCY